MFERKFIDYLDVDQIYQIKKSIEEYLIKLVDQNKITAEFSEIKETDLRIMLEDWLEGYRD